MKKLNIIPQKRINTYLDTAYKCSILCTRDNFDEWYNSKFIQVYSYQSQKDFIKLNYKGSTFQKILFKDVLYITYYKPESIKQDIIKFIVEQIDSNNYLELSLDEYYIKDKLLSGVNQFLHPSLIYGYDLAKSEIYAIGFNKQQFFTYITISVDELKQAYNSFLRGSEKSQHALACSTFSVNSNLSKCSFDLKEFLDELKEYVFSIRYDSNVGPYIEEKYIESFQFGLDTYKAVYESFNNPIYRHVDYRAFHLISEHKRELYEKLNFICRCFTIQDAVFADMLKKYYNSVVIPSDALRIYYIKSEMLRNINGNTIMDKLRAIEESDAQLSRSIYNYVSSLIER